MKPSVHLEERSTGKRWIGSCPDGPYPGNFISLGSGDFPVGRDPGNLIVLDDGSVSSRHAVLRVVDTRLYVLDLGSTNGTFVNRKRTEAWVEARPGDSIRFSDLEMTPLRVVEGSSPVRPEHLAWDGGTVVKVAGAIRASGSWRDLPVLADALEESGWSDPEVLACLRRADNGNLTASLLEMILSGGAASPAVHVCGRTMQEHPIPSTTPARRLCLA